MEITSYRDLKVWQAAIDLAEGVYSLSRDFPKAELYGLTAQMRRAAVSIAANIAEGHGSVKELETHLIIAGRLDLAAPRESEKLLARCDELGRMVRGLIRSLQERQGDA
jgi:hypothetical protein